MIGRCSINSADMIMRKTWHSGLCPHLVNMTMSQRYCMSVGHVTQCGMSLRNTVNQGFPSVVHTDYILMQLILGCTDNDNYLVLDNYLVFSSKHFQMLRTLYSYNRGALYIAMLN